ncbi:MAG: hypothetical protein PHQ98_00815 [Candidatus ainarchaeum sp.]|nr:hypothetical protein [Candidatus ainarchaeum sp.]
MNNLILNTILFANDAVSFVDTNNQIVTLASQNWMLIVVGIALIIISIFLLAILKKVIINSVIGGVVLLLTHFIFGIPALSIPNAIICIIFGPAGVGVLIVLNLLGIVV